MDYHAAKRRLLGTPLYDIALNLPTDHAFTSHDILKNHKTVFEKSGNVIRQLNRSGLITKAGPKRNGVFSWRTTALHSRLVEMESNNGDE